MARDPRKLRVLPETPEAVRALYRRLEEENGIDPTLASERLHEIKDRNGFGAADNVALSWCGDVFDPNGVDDPDTRVWLGSLTAGGARRGRNRRQNR